MDPITLFGLAAAATLSGTAVAMGTKLLYNYIKQRRFSESSDLTLREVAVETNTTESPIQTSDPSRSY